MERFRHNMYPESDAGSKVRGLEYDGIWIDMNEPASFTAGRPGADGYTQEALLCHPFFNMSPSHLPKTGAF